MTRFIITLLCLAFSVQASANEGQSETPAKPESSSVAESKQPAIEVVFVLDSTGSMSGLIAAAKDKIWAVANSLAQMDPAPTIRMGLVGYRDRGDDYITKRTNLTTDLDQVYADLMAFQAQGGGDTPESVNQALYEAVAQTTWTQDDPDIYRVVFLAGDCPPHMDYEDDVKYMASCKLAKEQGIRINTIQCGNHQATTPIWKDIAQRGNGNFMRVAQDGATVSISTPYDEQIAQIARKLDQSCIYYGKQSVREGNITRKAQSMDFAESAPAAQNARRAFYNSSVSGQDNFLGTQELVAAVREEKVDLTEIPKDELPEDLRKLSDAELEANIAQRITERQELEKQLAELNRQRTAYINQSLDKEAAKDSVEYNMWNTMKSQSPVVEGELKY